ncbi:MAG: peptidylprolyl isomerase [Acidiferrobacterales bacterium]|nr:peptidylprolyl isomerase [Acidiferrobacterales bacterium]
MKKIIKSAAFTLVLAATVTRAEVELSNYKSSAELLEALPDSAWRTLSPENTIVMTLPTGKVIIELVNDFASNHVANIKTLVKEKYFDGTAVIRSQDNYVAQWGDTTDVDGDDPNAKLKSIGSAKEKIEVEFFENLKDVPFTSINSRDAYADQVGFVNGLPAASDGERVWLSHCYGMVGVSRGMERDSGNGSGLYAITGHAPRHLDLNVTLVGKVWLGMEHLSSLPRGKGALGFYTSAEQYVPISDVRFLEKDKTIRVMKTDTPEFKRFVELRTTRNEDWFIEPTGKIELCNVWVPVKD